MVLVVFVSRSRWMIWIIFAKLMLVSEISCKLSCKTVKAIFDEAIFKRSSCYFKWICRQSNWTTGSYNQAYAWINIASSSYIVCFCCAKVDLLVRKLNKNSRNHLLRCLILLVGICRLKIASIFSGGNDEQMREKRSNREEKRHSHTIRKKWLSNRHHCCYSMLAMGEDAPYNLHREIISIFMFHSCACVYNVHFV